MKKLENILPKILNKYNLKKSAYASQVCQAFHIFLKENFNSSLKDNFLSIKFKNGYLIVKVKNSSLAHQIFLIKEDFLQKNKSRFHLLKNIVIKVSDH